MPATLLPRWVAVRRSRQLVLRMLPAVCALLGLIGVGGYLLVSNALKQDEDVQDRARTFIHRSIEQMRNEIGRNVVNYAKWGEAYRNLHVKVDKVWADEQRNVGDIPYDLYGYNGVHVINGADRTVYSVIDGRSNDMQAGQWMNGPLAALLEAARSPDRQDTSVVQVFAVGQAPALAAAATITPGWDPQITRLPGPESVLIFTTVLDAPTLGHLSTTYGLPELSVSLQPLPGHDAISLLGSPIFLNWLPPEPGLTLLKRTLPIFIAAVLALAVILIVLIRHALITARELDAQFDALLTSKAELGQSEQRFRDIAESSSDWLWEVDAVGRLTYLSERFTEVTGQERYEWIGRPIGDLLEPQTKSLHHWFAQSSPFAGPRRALRCHYLDRDARKRICEVTARAIPGKGGYRGAASDITEEIEAQAEVRHLSLHDALTGLPNRRHLHQVLERFLDPSSPAELTVLNLDLDDFKPVNDIFGHATGDSVLVEIAHRLNAHIDSRGLAARLGGDEFIAVVFDALDEGEIAGLCSTLISALSSPVETGGSVTRVGISIGVARAPQDAQTPDVLLQYSDIALYHAKEAGRNTWRIFDVTMHERVQARRRSHAPDQTPGEQGAPGLNAFPTL